MRLRTPQKWLKNTSGSKFGLFKRYLRQIRTNRPVFKIYNTAQRRSGLNRWHYMKTLVCNGNNEENRAAAASLLCEGQVVAVPTETVYGLAAVYNSEEGLKKIFEAKNRPVSDPLILHITNRRMLESLVENISPMAEQLMQSFWPGPLTLVFKKKPEVSGLVTAGMDTVAVREPENIIMRDIIERVGAPLAAPSANRFQSISPTSAAAVEAELGERIPMIVDGGECERGLESTIVSVVGAPVILRRGAIPAEDVEMSLGQKIGISQKTFHESSAVAAPAPGMLSFHYAPKTPLKVFMSQELLLSRAAAGPSSFGLLVFSPQEAIALSHLKAKTYVLSQNENLSEAGKNLFKTMRTADMGGHAIIYVLSVPDKGLGQTINDRLSKAQHD